MKGTHKKTGGIDPDYEERRKVALRAYEKGLLIHSQTTGMIYTPREFLDSNEKVIYELRGVETYSNLTHFYPKAAIETKLGNLRRARGELEKAERDLQDFMDRLLKAFEVLPKNKQ
jgi:hypothetical protein